MALDNGYWERLKDFYDNRYIGIVAQEKDVKMAQQMIDGGATFIDYDDKFDPDVVGAWVKNMIQLAREEFKRDGGRGPVDISNTTIFKTFPDLFDYYNHSPDISAYFMDQDLEKFEKELKDGNQAYAGEAIRLNWTMMLEKIPAVKDIFLF